MAMFANGAVASRPPALPARSDSIDAGSKKRNVVPLPETDWISMLPPSSTITCRTACSPTPRPEVVVTLSREEIPSTKSASSR